MPANTMTSVATIRTPVIATASVESRGGIGAGRRACELECAIGRALPGLAVAERARQRGQYLGLRTHDWWSSLGPHDSLPAVA